MDDDDIEWIEQDRCRRCCGDEDGTLIAKVGLVVVDVEAGREAFQVAGVGGVIVTRSERGKGHLRPLLEAALERAATLGAGRAMLFCAERNVGLYERFGFAVIDGAGRSPQQPSGAAGDADARDVAARCARA